MAQPDDWSARREPRAPGSDDARTPGEVDYARVIHSASFRRLQGKTQILNLGDSDFYRTRLTHSLEVAQIAGGLVGQLRHDAPDHPATAILPEHSLIQAIGCAHDLGHPPFGHGGEVALNYCMCGQGGFEGNGQTLRLLSRLEAFSAEAGANLTRRSLLGVLKYPAPFSALCPSAPRLAEGPSTLRVIDVAASTPPKCYLDSEADVVGWILAPLAADDRARFTAIDAGRTRHKSLDCSLMDIADDIAYGVHDLEDAIALGLVSAEQFAAAVTAADCASFVAAEGGHAALVSALFGSGTARKRSIGRIVHHLIAAIRYVGDDGFAEPLLRWRVRLEAEPAAFLKALKAFVMDTVIRSPGVQQLEFKGQGMVVAVFEALRSDPMRLLPREAQARFKAAGDDTRVICDFVAGMTDTYLLRTYERLFAPRMGSVFDRL